SPLNGPGGENARLPIVVGLADGLRRGGHRLFDLPGDASVGNFLGQLSEAAKRVAASDESPLNAREQAIALIGHRPFVEVKTLLADLFDPGRPQSVQLASARVLAAYSKREVATILLRPWRGLTPTVRGEVLQILLSRSL